MAASCGITAAVTTSSASAATGSSAPIVVGGDGDLSISAGVGQGFEAGIYRFNKAGGLDGRKIEFTGFLDDGFSPQTNLTNAQQLVQNKHVMAVIPMLSQVATVATGSFWPRAKRRSSGGPSMLRSPRRPSGAWASTAIRAILRSKASPG